LRLLKGVRNRTVLHAIHATNPGFAEVEARILSCNIGIVSSHRNPPEEAARNKMCVVWRGNPTGTAAAAIGLLMTMGDSLGTMGKGAEFGGINMVRVAGKQPRLRACGTLSIKYPAKVALVAASKWPMEHLVNGKRMKTQIRTNDRDTSKSRIDRF
jgi:hypothetical protein